MTKRNSIILSIVAAITLLSGVVASTPAFAAECGGAKTSIIDCGGATGEGAIFGIIKIVIQIMTAGIGIVAVGAVIFGAILYSSSAGSPEGIKKAKGIWMNTVIGLILFAFMVGITNFLVPGGVF